MSTQSVQKERVRAWVLIRAESEQKIVEAIADKIVAKGKEAKEAKDDNLVIIRVDVVKGREDSLFNLVVPIDTSSAVFETVVNDIEIITGGKVEVFVVSTHNPKPPHIAEGFITHDEAHADPDIASKIITIGRQSHSPGHNPWG